MPALLDRTDLRLAYRMEEEACLAARIIEAAPASAVHAPAAALAARLIDGARSRKARGLDAFLHAYGLGTDEGIALMCLAEALLRIPDADTADKLIADKVGGLPTLIAGSAMQMLALIAYIPFDGLASLYVVSAIFGLSQGGIVPSYALIIRDHFPAREAGSRISTVLTATVFGMALGGWMSGEIYDWTGSYTMAFLNGVAWNVLNLGIALWILYVRRPAAPLAAAAA